jgi:pyruvate,water dikinase
MNEYVIPLSASEAADASRTGPKAANLAALGHAGLPIPDGFCLEADAYRHQIAALGLAQTARGVFAAEGFQARRHALDMKLRLMSEPVAPEVRDALLVARSALMERNADAPVVVRSSALVEDRKGSSFAGQFESYLQLDGEDEFLTAVRACWAALWSTRALRYMATHGFDPADTAMAVLVQPLVAAKTAGGALSRTSADQMLINATWGLGSSIAQGEVAPDRYVLSREGKVREAVTGFRQLTHAASCAHLRKPAPARPRAGAPCLTTAQAAELGALVRKTETVMGMPVEVEWAMDDGGFRLLQARPLALQPDPVPVVDENWRRHPRINGQPAGLGWATGRACVVNCECELIRVAPGDVLVTRMAGPALSQILQRVAGVVAELGGSTSHLASLARERGIPMVLGAFDATHRIPDGSLVAVDGVAGVVRWQAQCEGRVSSVE